MTDKANETEVIPKCARVECQTLRAQLDDAKDLLRDAGFLLIPNAPKHSHRICIFLAKLEELEK